MNKRNTFILFLVIILATFSRLFITIPNFTAIGALALFCGAVFHKNRFSIAIPFAALILGDLLLASTGKIYSDYFMDGYFLYVYVAFGLTWLIGRFIKNKRNFSNVAVASLVASLSFFLITNFGSWLQMPFYPKTLEGLGQAYAAGLIFYKGDLLSNFFANLVIGDLFFNALFFGLFAYISKPDYSKLRPVKVRN